MRPRRRVLGRAALFAAVLALAAYVVYVRAFVPLSRDAEGLDERMGVARQNMAGLPEKAGTLARLRGEYVQTALALEELESTVTRGEGIAYFLGDLENASSASGVTVVSLSVGVLERSSPYAELPMTVGVSGSYPQVRAFVNELLSQRRALSVRTIRLSASRGTDVAGGAPVLDAGFVVVLYVMPEGGRKE